MAPRLFLPKAAGAGLAGRPTPYQLDGGLTRMVPRRFQPKPACAGLAGRPTLLSLADRDLVFQDRPVVAASGAEPRRLTSCGRLDAVRPGG